MDALGSVGRALSTLCRAFSDGGEVMNAPDRKYLVFVGLAFRIALTACAASRERWVLETTLYLVCDRVIHC